MKHLVALMDNATRDTIEAGSLSVSLTKLTLHTHSKGSSLDLITCTTDSINSQNRLHIWFQHVPLSARMPCSYHTHGLKLRVTIIYLNHALVLVQCVPEDGGYTSLMQFVVW